MQFQLYLYRLILIFFFIVFSQCFTHIWNCYRQTIVASPKVVEKLTFEHHYLKHYFCFLNQLIMLRFETFIGNGEHASSTLQERCRVSLFETAVFLLFFVLNIQGFFYLSANDQRLFFEFLFLSVYLFMWFFLKTSSLYLFVSLCV